MQARPLDSRPPHRFQRYVVLLAIATTITSIIFLLAPGSTLGRMSMATAYASLILLALTLIIGPLNVLRAKWNPLSSYLRRDLGILGGIAAIVHVILGLQVHSPGDFIQYFFHRTPQGRIGALRLDAFGITNHLGLIATLIILILLGISNDLSIRKLGAERWKAIQRWNYALALLVIMHGLVYQSLERRNFAFVAFFLIVAAITFTLQGLGFRRKRAKQSADRGPLKSMREE